MRILITGATGQIGKKLIAILKNSGHELRILARKKPDRPISRDQKFEFAIGDIEDAESLKKATQGIDTVIHLAALTHTNNQKLYYRINTQGTENLVRASEKNNVKNFIYISSKTASIEGGAYAHSKLLAEELIKKSSLNWIILRPSEVYGASDKEAISKLIGIIKKSPIVPVIGNGEYLLNPVHIDDLINVIAVIVNKNIYSRKIYIIEGPENISYNDLIGRLEKIYNLKKIKVHIPILFVKLIAYLLFLIGKNMFTIDQIPRLLCKKIGNADEAKKDLEFNPRSIEIGLKSN